jgi:hypothetical protein
MPSYDLSATIERFPCYDEGGNLDSVSYGCPDLDLMGYTSLPELLFEIRKYFTKHFPERTRA